MTRQSSAEMIIVFIALLAVAAIVATVRYRRWVRRRSRGHRNDKPVWKPFWLE